MLAPATVSALTARFPNQKEIAALTFRLEPQTASA